MDNYTKLLSIVDSPEVNEGADLPKVKLHKWLILGQSDWMCRYGTLSEGHEKITDAQRYPQAIKELYYLSLNIKSQKAIAKRAQASLIRANTKLSTVTNEADKLEAEADKEDAEAQLASALVIVEDQMRMVNTYRRVIKELGPKVEARYPEGLEQAEPDNWKAVYEYRILISHQLGLQQLSNIPLPPEEKAKLGIEYGRKDSLAPLLVTDKDKAVKLLTKRED